MCANNTTVISTQHIVIQKISNRYLVTIRQNDIRPEIVLCFPARRTALTHHWRSCRPRGCRKSWEWRIDGSCAFAQRVFRRRTISSIPVTYKQMEPVTFPTNLINQSINKSIKQSITHSMDQSSDQSIELMMVSRNTWDNEFRVAAMHGNAPPDPSPKGGRL